MMLNIMHSRIQQLVRFSYENTHATCLQVYSPKCGEQASFQLRQAQKLFQMRKASFQSRQAQKLFFGAEFYAQPNSAVMIQLLFFESSNMLASELSRWASAGAKPCGPFWMAFLVFSAL